MQIEILNDMMQAKRALKEAKQALDAMSVSLISSITDSIKEYNEVYETNYVLSTEDVVKQLKKRKPGRPTGKANVKGSNGDKLIEFLRSNGPSRPRDIASGTTIPPGSLNSILKGVAGVTKLSNGWYSFSDDSTSVLVP